MTKLIASVLLLFLYSCDQTQKRSKVSPHVRNLQMKIIPLVSYLDNPDSCRKGLSFLDSASAIDSTCYLCYYNKLMFLSSLDQNDKVVHTIDTLIKLSPFSHELYLLGGIWREKIRDSLSAKIYFQKSLAICNSVLDTMNIKNSNYFLVVANKAQNLIMLGNPTEANAILKKFNDTQPDDLKFDNVIKKYITSLMNKNRSQLINTFVDSIKNSR